MGNNFCCGEQNPQLARQVTQLHTMLALADKSQSSSGKFTALLDKHSNDIKSMISSASYARQIFGSVTVEVVPCSQQAIAQPHQQILSKAVKLVLRGETQEESESIYHEKKQEDETYEGCIVFTEAYYYGEIKAGMAHGRGTLHLPTHSQYQVSGTWHQDSLKSADFYQIKYRENGQMRQKQFELELIKGEKEAVVKVDGKFEYRGSIKLRGASSIYEIMTGKGVVKYQNGDQYHGQLSNGLYNTVKQQAECRYASGQYSRFKGHFKSGLRQGRGTLTMLVKDQLCDLRLEYINGSSFGEAQLHFICENAHFPVDIQNNTPVISNHRLLGLQS